jgi:hypothetical protein
MDDAPQSRPPETNAIEGVADANRGGVRSESAFQEKRSSTGRPGVSIGLTVCSQKHGLDSPHLRGF